MIKVAILYPNKEGSQFDLDYYLNTHVPMAIEKFGSYLKGISIEYGLSDLQPGTKPTNTVIANLTFDSVEAFRAAFDPHAQVLLGDIPNYTNVEPTVQLSEVKMSQ